LNFEPAEDQLMIAESFARFFDEHSSMARVRAAMPLGFDAALWRGLAEMGAFAMRVPESAGGLELGLLDAALVMEEAGRTLASGPVAWRRSWGSRPSDGYDRPGKTSRTDVSCIGVATRLHVGAAGCAIP